MFYHLRNPDYKSCEVNTKVCVVCEYETKMIRGERPMNILEECTSVGRFN